MEAGFRASRHGDGVVEGVEAISRLLAAHFPRDRESANELPDKPVVL
jgi:uncharacterized membrane protein